MKPTINLATHSHINRRAVLAVYVIAGLVLVVSLGFNLFYWLNSRQQLVRVESHLAELEGQLGIDSQAPPVSDAEFAAQLEKIRFSNQVIAKDSYRWTELLGQLEKVIVPNVRVSSIDPIFKENRFKLQGEAKRVEDLRDFLDALEESPYFYDILLLAQSEQEVDRSNSSAMKVITFSLKLGGGKV